MQNKTGNILIILSLSITTFFSGCTKNTKEITKNTSPETSFSKTTLKIGYIARGLTDSDSQRAINVFNKTAATLNIEVIPTIANSDKKIFKNIDYIKSKGGKGIIISSSDTQMGSAIAAKAKKLNLKIIAIRNRMKNFNGTYTKQIPFVGISVENNADLISSIMLSNIKNNNLDIDTTGILFLKETPGSLFESCINKSSENLKKSEIPKKNIFICNVIPAPDSVIVSPDDLKKIKAGNFTKWIIFGFNINNTVNIANLVTSEYMANRTNDILSMSIIYNRNYMDNHIQSVDYIGSIYINSELYAQKAIKLLRNWIKDNNTPPEFTEIPTDFINNPNYKK